MNLFIRAVLFLLVLAWFHLPLQAQLLPDTLRANSRENLLSVGENALDSVTVRRGTDPQMASPLKLSQGLAAHPYYNFQGKPIDLYMQERIPQRDELLFYLLAALFLYYAMIRMVYARYHENLIKLFLRATLRQQQLREQLLQTPLPSFLLNLMFIINAAAFCVFWFRSKHYASQQSFLALFLYGVGAFSLIYLGKYFILKLFGWMVNLTRAIDAYLFTVFLINKVAGIFLLPVILLLSFPYLRHAGTLVPFTLGVLLLLLIYRFWVSFQQVRHEIKLKLFHFFIYICGFEIAPLLVIFKVVMNFVRGTV